MTLDLESFELPAHWASALINADVTGLDPRDQWQLDQFTNWMIKKYGSCHAVDCSEESNFKRWHEAARFGALACDVLKFTFDVTKRAGTTA